MAMINQEKQCCGQVKKSSGRAVLARHVPADQVNSEKTQGLILAMAIPCYRAKILPVSDTPQCKERKSGLVLSRQTGQRTNIKQG